MKVMRAMLVWVSVLVKRAARRVGQSVEKVHILIDMDNIFNTLFTLPISTGHSLASSLMPFKGLTTLTSSHYFVLFTDLIIFHLN